MKNTKFSSILFLAAFVCAFFAGAFGAKTMHKIRMANLRDKYAVLLTTSPETEKNRELTILEAAKRIAKKSGGEVAHFEKGMSDLLVFYDRLKQETGENTLLYYESERGQWSQGYLVVDFFGNVVHHIDATQIRKAENVPE